METIYPPGLSSKPFEYYKQQILAWREITDVCKTKQGIVIALSLPEDDPFQIKERVFNEINLDDLRKENGLEILLQFMSAHLGKDEFTDCTEKIENFENFQRIDKQSIREYIACFDLKYRKLEKLQLKLPQEILAFKLLRGANIGDQQKMIVLTGVNYANKETLYEDTKQSLKKFMGDITKTESDFFEKHGKEFLDAAFVKQGSGDNNLRNLRRERYRGVGDQGSCNREMRKKRNPVGANGRALRCKSFGSFHHLVAECPDSWENMNKQNYEKSPNCRHEERSRGISMNGVQFKGECSMSAINTELTAEISTLDRYSKNGI